MLLFHLSNLQRNPYTESRSDLTSLPQKDGLGCKGLTGLIHAKETRSFRDEFWFLNPGKQAHCFLSSQVNQGNKTEA